MRRFFTVFFVFLLVCTCSAEKLHCLPHEQSLQDEAGFITIKPVDFYFSYQSYFSKLALRSSEACLWYSFQPAEQNCAGKPLFVFFNGGPSAATSSGLFCFNTSRMTLDTTLENGGEEFIPNQVSWTRLGNLLYIDAQVAGFSYNVMNNPRDRNARLREFDAQNFNIYTDAADFIRVLLEFLGSHPELQDNPVILVSESYGGVRSNMMLHILLNYNDYANGKETYQDSALIEKIQAHYNAVFPGYNEETVPPEIIATQFGHQILIQPSFAPGYQHQVAGELFEKEGSIIFQIAEESGLQYVPCRQKQSPPGTCNPRRNALGFIESVAKRDSLIYTKPYDWLLGFFLKAGILLRFTDNLSHVTGVDVTSIPLLYASARGNAYKQINAGSPGEETNKLSSFKGSFLKTLAIRDAGAAAEGGDLSDVFGVLQPWDRYFMAVNDDGNGAFHFNIALFRGYDIDRFNPRLGRLFLKNVVYVNTFITNAAYDLRVYSRAIPPTLELYTGILDSVVHDTAKKSGEDRPGRIILDYKENAFPGINNLHTRTMRFPLYETSGHAVSVNQPVELFHDVSDWLIDTGLTNLDRYRR